MTIIFYDIPSNVKNKPWSPNTWKVRFCLNYKELPYKTEWVELPDIEETCKKVGIPPTSTKADGTPFYTLPAIHDTDTGVALAEAFRIAEYLEKTYPARSVFPYHTVAFQSTYDDTLRRTALSYFYAFLVYDTFSHLNPRSADYYRPTREKMFGGKALKDIAPNGDEAIAQWAAFKDGLGTVKKWYDKTGSTFILGETASWADFLLAARLMWAKRVWGEDHPKWLDLISWHDGRWRKLLEVLEPYSRVAD